MADILSLLCYGLNSHFTHSDYIDNILSTLFSVESPNFNMSQDVISDESSYREQTDEAEVANETHNLGEDRRDKLNSLFKDIVAEAAIDFNDEKIKSVQASVMNLVERAKQYLNEQIDGFNISRIVPCGSMAEKSSLWKLSNHGLTYIEYDFLAVLHGYNDNEIVQGCSGCKNVTMQSMFKTELQPKSTEQFPQILIEKFDQIFQHTLYQFLTHTMCDTVRFWYTADRFEMFCEHDMRFWYTFSKHLAKDVGTSGETEWRWECSCKNQTSPESRQDDPLSQLKVLIDFVPALELEDGNFIVAKPCTTCYHGWRISGCKAEIDRVLSIPDQHKKCYQVLKYFFQFPKVYGQNYYMKTAFLNHTSVCSDTSNNYTKCVFEVLRDIAFAYEHRTMKAFSQNSERNLFADPCSFDGWNEKGLQLLIAALSRFENWETLKKDLDIKNCLDIFAIDTKMLALP